MSIPKWPKEQLPEFSSISEIVGGSVVRTTMDNGVVRQIKRFDGGPRSFDISLDLDKFQYELFKIFFLDILDQGSKYFLKKMFPGDSVETPVRFVNAEYDCNYQPFMRFIVTAELESRYEPRIDRSATLSALTSVGSPNVENFTLKTEQLYTTTNNLDL